MKKAQNLMEYILIFMLVVLVCAIVATKFDLTRIRNYVFVRPADSGNKSQITIEAMTK